MDLDNSCKDKLAYFRIKELKDVLGQLGLAKQGKKQDLMDRILSVLSDEQVTTPGLAKKVSIGKDRVAKIVDDTYRKMQLAGANDLASKNNCISDVKTANPTEEREDSSHLDMKVRCLCGGSLITESMIKCEGSRCHVWQHIGCVLIQDKPLDGIMPEIPTSFYCELCRLNRADPFWLTVAHPLHPVKLISPGTAPDGSNPLHTVERIYPLSRVERELLQRSDHDLQVWCILLNDKIQFRMQWPQYPELLINGVQIRTINRAASQLLGISGRDDGPVVTTCSREGSNKISLSFGDARVFCFGVRIVRRRTVQQVLSMVPKEAYGERFEDALARVRRCIGGGAAAENADSDSDLEVVADTVSVNLRCPMSGSRMKIAGRFKPCVHMGCFDLETYVELNQRSRKWQCPICLKNYSLENMIIDPYFNRITSLMQNCGEDVNEIDVKPDGSWRAKISGDIKDLLQWHLPDGTLCSVTDVEVKPDVGIYPQIKKEIISDGYTGLKLGIKKNNNGDWEFNKPGVSGHHQSLGTLALERSGDFCQNIIPTSSSATGSCRDGEDPSVNQDGGGSFDLQFNGHELDSIALDLYKVDVCPPVTLGNANVIILSDSDEDNITMSHGTAHDTIPSNFDAVPADHRVVADVYPDESGLRADAAYLGFCDNSADDFEMPLWPLQTCPQNGPGLKLFGSDADVSDAFAGLGPDDYNLRSNGFGEACQVQDLPSCPDNSSNGGLMNSNPLAYRCGDPSLQLFLPNQPVANVPSQTDFGGHAEMDNGISPDDWMSLSLGGVIEPHFNSTSANGQSSERHFGPEENRMESLATASLLLSMSGDRTSKSNFNGEKSGISFSHPRQPRSARKRHFQSINLDSDTD